MPQGRFHKDQSGTKIGMLTLLKLTDQKTANGGYKYLVRCDCGVEKVIGYSYMTQNKTKSCGCLQKRKGKDSPNFKHGLSQHRDTAEYKRYQRECFDRSKYGLEPDHKEQLFAAQGGACYICRYAFGQKTGDMKVDHDHDTGEVRGLLCDLCNRGLGMFRDNITNLNKAISYLAR
jgi:hypothetical protein